MKRKECVYIAIKLDEKGFPKIIGTFREEDDATKQRTAVSSGVTSSNRK